MSRLIPLGMAGLPPKFGQLMVGNMTESTIDVTL